MKLLENNGNSVANQQTNCAILGPAWAPWVVENTRRDHMETTGNHICLTLSHNCYVRKVPHTDDFKVNVSYQHYEESHNNTFLSVFHYEETVSCQHSVETVSKSHTSTYQHTYQVLDALWLYSVTKRDASYILVECRSTSLSMEIHQATLAYSKVLSFIA